MMSSSFFPELVYCCATLFLFIVNYPNLGVVFLVKNMQVLVLVVGELSSFLIFFAKADPVVEFRFDASGDCRESFLFEI